MRIETLPDKRRPEQFERNENQVQVEKVTEMMLNQKQLKLFWDKVDKKTKNKCWNWKASLQRGGYGSFHLRCLDTARAHRVSWMIHFGKTKLHVLHKCDNPKCVNPNHLFLGDEKKNILDMVEKGRHWNQIKKRCKRGHVFAIRNGKRICRPCKNLKSRERYNE